MFKAGRLIGVRRLCFMPRNSTADFLKLTLWILLSMVFFSQNAWSKSKVRVLTQEQRKVMAFVEKLRSFTNNNIHYEIEFVDKNLTFDGFKTLAQTGKYDLNILVDNKLLEFQQQFNEKFSPLKALSVLSLNIDDVLKDRRHIVGVRFEPPVFTLVTSFRYLFDYKIERVLTFYRKGIFDGQVEKARRDLLKAGIKLEAIEIEEKPSIEASIQSALLKAQNTLSDAIWIPLDSVLLGADFFTKYWLPFSKDIKKPILAQVEELASSKLNFASYAISTDMVDLADQVHQLVEAILLQKLPIAEIGVENSISVKKFVNGEKLRTLNLPLLKEKKKEVIILE